jgi:hypothetical protein
VATKSLPGWPTAAQRVWQVSRIASERSRSTEIGVARLTWLLSIPAKVLRILRIVVLMGCVSIRSRCCPNKREPVVGDWAQRLPTERWGVG